MLLRDCWTPVACALIHFVALSLLAQIFVLQNSYFNLTGFLFNFYTLSRPVGFNLL